MCQPIGATRSTIRQNTSGAGGAGGDGNGASDAGSGAPGGDGGGAYVVADPVVKYLDEDQQRDLLVQMRNQMLEAAEKLTDGLTADEKERVFGGTAAEFYRIEAA